jgi:enoyl-CoA hydratase
MTLTAEQTYTSPTERVNSWLDETTLFIEFNNPVRHNALSVDMWEAVPILLARAELDHRVRLVVFQGAGTKAFVSGADISQFEDMRAAREAVTRYEAMAEAALMGIYNFSKPTLACIQGYCIGGGVNVAISCDMRISSDNAVFSVPAARLGLGYRYSAMKNLVDLIGPSAAKDLFFTARRIDGIEAHRLGLVNRICPVDQLATLLTEYKSALANNAPLTIQAAKAITREVLKASPEIDVAMCQQLIRGCFDSADYAEGRKAFMEKRQPVFVGN